MLHPEGSKRPGTPLESAGFCRGESGRMAGPGGRTNPKPEGGHAMKRATAISLVVLVAFVAGRLSHEPTVNAQQQPAPTCADLNGDGSVNITDAVRLVRWLFLRGPEPLQGS